MNITENQLAVFDKLIPLSVAAVAKMTDRNKRTGSAIADESTILCV